MVNYFLVEIINKIKLMCVWCIWLIFDIFYLFDYKKIGFIKSSEIE